MCARISKTLAPGYRPQTHAAIGYPVDGNPLGSIPGINIYWEQDGTVIYVSCADLVSAGLSPTIAFCTNLDIPGVPAGGLESVWQQIMDGTWDHSEPFPQINLDTWDYDPQIPQPGHARHLGIGGPTQIPVTATNPSGL